VKDPESRIFSLTGGKTCVIIPIEGDEYVACMNPNMWCTSNEDYYKKGMLNTPDDEDLTERSGRLGECACSKVFNAEVDFSRIDGGDSGIDFTLSSGLTVDVKTSQMHTVKYFGKNFTTAMTAKGAWKKLTADVYLGAFIEKEDRENRTATVVLTGWMNRSQLFKNGDHLAPETRRNPNPKHRNYEMPYNLQLPILDLITGDRQYAKRLLETRTV